MTDETETTAVNEVPETITESPVDAPKTAKAKKAAKPKKAKKAKIKDYVYTGSYDEVTGFDGQTCVKGEPVTPRGEAWAKEYADSAFFEEA